MALSQSVVNAAPQSDTSALAQAWKIGSSSPLGATISSGGATFSIYSRKASSVDLLLFDHEDDPTPSRVITINPETNRTYHYWHVFVPGIQPGQIYAYRVDGPFDPANGLRFDPSKFSSTPTAAASSSQKTTTALPPARPATTPPPP